MAFTNNHRFSIAAFAIATAATAALHGTMLVGFNQVASANDPMSTEARASAQARANLPTVTLERVVVSTRRA